MAPINNSSPSVAGGGTTGTTFVGRIGGVKTGIRDLINVFDPQGPLKVAIPDATPLPPGPYIIQVVLTGADMADYKPGVFNLPPEATGQLRLVVEDTRQLTELRGVLQEGIDEIDGILGNRRGQLAHAAGFFLSQVKALDAAPALPGDERSDVNDVKGLILRIVEDNNATVQMHKQHNQHLKAHGDQKVAAVQADLKISQAENQVLRGGALNKEALQAAPAPATHKKSGRRAPARKPPKGR